MNSESFSSEAGLESSGPETGLETGLRSFGSESGFETGSESSDSLTGSCGISF